MGIILVDKIKKVGSNKQTDMIADEINIPNHSGDHTAGTTTTPVNDLDIANKKYVDDNAGGSHTESSTDSLTNKTIDSFTNQVHADEVRFEARNESGSTIPKGSCVKVTGYNIGLDLALISLADASNASTMPAAGITEADVINNANVEVVVLGREDNLNTSAFTIGDCIYTSETAGEFSAAPTGTALIQRVGVVLRSHASLGRIEINIQPRQRSLPNLPDTKIWIGDTNGVPQEFALSVGATMTAGGVVTIADDFLKNDAADIGVGLQLTGDNSSADTQYTAQVLYNTDATPPTASGFPIGTIYIQYTA